MTAVSVHIVTYNHEKTIDRCIRALFAQTCKDFSVRVIDNASTDRTAAILRKFRVPAAFGSSNAGYAAAHNEAVRKTSSEFVMTLNPDVVLERDFLAEVLSGFRDAGPRAGSASGLLLRGMPGDPDILRIDSAGLFMTRNRRARLRLEGQEFRTAELKKCAIFGPDGAAAVYRRSMLEDIAVEGEIFDEDFFAYKEDVDVCWRAMARGWTSIFLPEAVGFHIRSFRPGQRAGVPEVTKKLSVRNRYLLMAKNDRVRDLIRDLPWIFGYDVFIFMYILFFERTSLSAYREAWRRLPGMIVKRKSVLKRIRVREASYRRRLFQH